jgi:hypothetical protein
MGSKASKARQDHRDAAAKEWSSRLERYFERYGKSPSKLKLLALVDAVVDDPAVWKALLMHYGPELDPPFDKPPAVVDEETRVRRRRMQAAAADGSLSAWASRLQNYFAVHDPTKTPEELNSFAKSVSLSDWPDVWRALLQKYGPEPQSATGSIAGTKSVTDRASAISGASQLTAVERHSRANAIVRCAKLLKQLRFSVAIDDVASLVDRYEGRREELWQCVQDDALTIFPRLDPGVDLTTAQKRGDLSRDDWCFVIQSLDPRRDPFEVESLLEDYDRRPGGHEELLALLTVQADDAFARNRRGADATASDEAIFWTNRVRSFLESKQVGLTVDDEIDTINRASAHGFRNVWRKLLADHGPEGRDGEAVAQHSKFYWIHRLADAFQARYGSSDADALKRARRSLDHCPNVDVVAKVARSMLLELDGEELREVQESMVDPDVSRITTEGLPPDTAEEDMWRVRLFDFYSAHDPSRVHLIADILDRAKQNPGGFDRMWQLLQVKYNTGAMEEGFEQNQRQRSSRRHVTTPSPDHPPKVSAAVSPRRIPPPSPPPRAVVAPSAPVPGANEVHLQVPRRFLELKAHVLVAEVGAPITAAQLQRRFREARTKGQAEAVLNLLERDFGRWEWPMMDEDFWEWRYAQLAAAAQREAILTPLPPASLPAAERYVALRDRFRGDGRSAADAFEDYRETLETQLERNHGWRSTTLPQLGTNQVGSRDFWQRKMDEYRRRTCPWLPLQKAINALDLAEVLEQSYKTVWDGFTKMCDDEARLHEASER